MGHFREMQADNDADRQVRLMCVILRSPTFVVGDGSTCGRMRVIGGDIGRGQNLEAAVNAIMAGGVTFEGLASRLGHRVESVLVKSALVTPDKSVRAAGGDGSESKRARRESPYPKLGRGRTPPRAPVVSPPALLRVGGGGSFPPPSAEGLLP